MFFGKADKRTINLALQGGGAHGAFTWGVLDGLLEDGRVEFDGVSGTSAGAMNAVVLAQGLMSGGRAGARAALEEFWTAVARSMPFEMARPSPDGQNVAMMPGLKTMLAWAHYFSPDQLNPFDLNPLRDILSRQIDFERLRTKSPVKLFIAATNANSGKLRLFRSPELSIDAVLASSCLPMMNRTVEIDGEPYWDGGYAANPAVFPLFYECRSNDMLLVLLAPLKYKETPHSAQDIKNRVLELAFNSTFLREMRMFAHLRDYVDRSRWRLGYFERRLARTKFHIVDAQEAMEVLRPETKMTANQRFFETLRDMGRARAAAWLRTNRAHIGKRSTVDLSKLFY
ncbi:MAG TPA: patatin-like phospholipase family protein [Burkholderiaceae bacterium]|nr:patatin-like phospholipase family protein [Burkholderiaceae bacterium]